MISIAKKRLAEKVGEMIFSLRGWSGQPIFWVYTDIGYSRGCLLKAVDDRISDGMEQAENRGRKKEGL